MNLLNKYWFHWALEILVELKILKSLTPSSLHFDGQEAIK